MGTQQANSWTLEEEFWWLPESINPSLAYCELVHTNTPTAGRAPDLRHAPTESPHQRDARPMPVSYIPQWFYRWDGVNIHRSLTVYLDDDWQSSVTGPFVVDVDCPLEHPYSSRIEHARQQAIRVVDWLLSKFQLNETDIRCHFSGAKGFHVEARPESVGLHSGSRSEFKPAYDGIRSRLLLDLLGETGSRTHPSTNLLDASGCVINPIHEWVRLAYSINRWIEAGKPMYARRTSVTIEELRHSDFEQIIQRAQSNLFNP